MVFWQADADIFTLEVLEHTRVLPLGDADKLVVQTLLL